MNKIKITEKQMGSTSRDRWYKDLRRKIRIFFNRCSECGGKSDYSWEAGQIFIRKTVYCWTCASEIGGMYQFL